MNCVKTCQVEIFCASRCSFILRTVYVFNLFYHRMVGGILRGSRKERLLSKFVENECEKIDRLMELYMR